MEVREMIAKLMQDKGVTYAELEKRTGLSRSMLNRYVTGVTRKIPIDNMEKIAKALNVPPVNFILGEIEIKPEEGHSYIDPAAAIAREVQEPLSEEPEVSQEDLKQKKVEFMLDALERLAKLYEAGALTEAEYSKAKAQLLEVGL